MFLQGIGAGVITELQTLFATTLKAEPHGYRHFLNTIVSGHAILVTTLLQIRGPIPKLVESR